MGREFTHLKAEIASHLLRTAVSLGVDPAVFPALENPKDPSHGDLALPAFPMAKSLKKPPMEIARLLAAASLPPEWVSSAEATPPGYVNLRLNPRVFHETLEDILDQNDRFGKSRQAEGMKLLLEFVSANPTGPLNVVNARAAALGDAIRRLLLFAGAEVSTEYYVNDAGVQAKLFGESLLAACDRVRGIPTPPPENGYRGAYLEDLAREFMASPDWPERQNLPKTQCAAYLGEVGMKRVVEDHRKSLERYGVSFDRFYSERRELHETGQVAKTVSALDAKGLILEKDGARWLKVSAFGAPKDEVLIKSDGAPAYFAADIAYHLGKFDRGFNRLLDIWGPDHHGHILRMSAALKAAGYPQERFSVLIGQQVSLLSGGEKVKMSKREGRFVTLEELLDEVGVDAARFFFVMRSASSHLDFDLEVAKKQTDENPVFYVQYAHARICSLIAKCASRGLHPATRADQMTPLTEKESTQLLKSILQFPGQVAEAGLSYEPNRLVAYVMGLAADFHVFYTQHRILDAVKETAEARLALAQGVRVVLRNALRLIGVSAPEAM